MTKIILTILVLNRFGEPFAAARALTLSTYYSAQWLIANSNYTQLEQFIPYIRYYCIVHFKITTSGL